MKKASGEDAGREESKAMHTRQLPSPLVLHEPSGFIRQDAVRIVFHVSIIPLTLICRPGLKLSDNSSEARRR